MKSQSPAAPTPLNLGFLWKHRFTMAFCGVVGVAIGFVYLKVVPPTYQAQARVLIEPQGITLEVDKGENPQPEFLPTQAETIRSPITISRALETVHVARPADVELEDWDPVRHVLKSLQATPILKANVLTISYQSTDPEEAVELISAVIESYRENVAAVDKGNWSANVQVIATRERELRKDLEVLQAEYAEHRAGSPLVADGRDGAGVALTQLNELNAHLAATQRRRLDLESRLSSLTTAVASITAPTAVTDDGEASSATPTRLVALKPVVEPMSTALIDQVINYSEPEDARKIEEIAQNLRFARLKADQYDSVYGEKHPDLIAARAEVAEHEALLHDRLLSIAGTWESELKTLDDTEQKLRSSYETEHAKVKEVDTYLVKDQSLQSNIRKVEDLHSATLAQLMEIQSADEALSEGRNSIDVRILESPQLLDEMVWPQPKPLLASAAIMGLLAGFCIVWLRAGSQPAVAESSRM